METQFTLAFLPNVGWLEMTVIGVVLLLFIIGAVLFYFVDEEKGRAEIAVLSGE